MDEVRLENFRCFREQQTARLAPLTLLVGENSTGKTSFLAMVRALNAIFAGKWEYNFKDEPYDLGSFDEIAPHRGGRGGRATEFTAGFSGSHVFRGSKSNRIALPYQMDLEFVRQGTVPVLRCRQWQSERAWISESFDPDKVEFGEGLDVWTWQTHSGLDGTTKTGIHRLLHCGDGHLFCGTSIAVKTSCRRAKASQPRLRGKSGRLSALRTWPVGAGAHRWRTEVHCSPPLPCVPSHIEPTTHRPTPSTQKAVMCPCIWRTSFSVSAKHGSR